VAKELPYFKFYVSEWNDGDITLEDYEVQGLFINICSYYWSNECNLTLKKAEKKFRNAEPDLWQTLMSEQLIKVDEKGYLSVSFLDEQAQERDKLCSTNSVNAKKGWDKRRENKRNESESNATALKPQSESSTESMQYREEEKREEEKRREKEQNELTPTQKVLVFTESDYDINLVEGFKRFIEFVEKTKHVKNISSQINITNYQKMCDEHTVDKLKQKIGELDNWLDDPNVPKGKKKKKSLPHLMNNTWLKNAY
jgi:hypothetical protein